MKRIASPILLGLLMGCGGESNRNVASDNEPLTVEAWKELEVIEKYEPETLERLKLNDPKLTKERNWNKFMRDVVVPERRIDIPTDY